MYADGIKTTNTTQIGRAVESAVARHLERKKYTFIEQNWRTRFCEVDLILKKDDTVFFVEVKYRSHAESGYGMDYVTTKKLKQMKYAAQLWCAKNRWEGDCRLLVASVDGETSRVALIEVD